MVCYFDLTQKAPRWLSSVFCGRLPAFKFGRNTAQSPSTQRSARASDREYFLPSKCEGRALAPTPSPRLQQQNPTAQFAGDGGEILANLLVFPAHHSCGAALEMSKAAIERVKEHLLFPKDMAAPSRA